MYFTYAEWLIKGNSLWCDIQVKFSPLKSKSASVESPQGMETVDDRNQLSRRQYDFARRLIEDANKDMETLNEWKIRAEEMVSICLDMYHQLQVKIFVI